MDQTGRGSRPAGDNCLRCGGVLTSMGVETFRTRGTSGGWKTLFGELAELGEDMIPFEVFACGNCRRVEMHLPQSAG